MTTSTTPPPPVPPGPPLTPYGDPAPAPRPTPRASRGAVALLVAVFVGLLVGAAANLVHLPYAVMSPGPATNVLGATGGGQDGKGRLITVSGRPTYTDAGALDFTTVRVQGGPGYPVSAWDVLQAWLSPTQDVYPVDTIFPPQQSQQDVTAENQAEMTDSQEVATAVALRHLGLTVPERVTIGQVAKDAPSGDALKAGDVVTSIDGVAITTPDVLRAQIQKATPGATLAFGVIRGGAPTTVQARTGRSSDGRTVVGVVPGVTYAFPFKVTIDAGDVGGPSAGLMFSLGLYDLLTPGSLTGGQKVAGTGTISPDGSVGPIGGIRQKMAGAREAGASWFLAPKDNCAEVVGHVPSGLTAVKVDTFDDAAAAVTAIGQGRTSSLPHC